MDFSFVNFLEMCSIQTYLSFYLWMIEIFAAISDDAEDDLKL